MGVALFTFKWVAQTANDLVFSRDDASLHERVSVRWIGPLVRWLVHPSVTLSLFGLLGATYAVYTALFYEIAPNLHEWSDEALLFHRFFEKQSPCKGQPEQDNHKEKKDMNKQKQEETKTKRNKNNKKQKQ